VTNGKFNAMRARLIPLDGGEPVELTRDLSVVGRKEDCDLRLDHKSVSKQHCVLAQTDGTVLLRDLGSTNGTRVNGTRVRRAVLLPNDVVAFAGFKFRVAYGADAVVGPSAMTQALDADDIAELVEAMPAKAEPESNAAPENMANVRTNELPDVYPNDAKDPI
jgi:pSer/pThr/pTyr-binding forkhead associated (FHA) protein